MDSLESWEESQKDMEEMLRICALQTKHETRKQLRNKTLTYNQI